MFGGINRRIYLLILILSLLYLFQRERKQATQNSKLGFIFFPLTLEAAFSSVQQKHEEEAPDTFSSGMKQLLFTDL